MTVLHDTQRRQFVQLGITDPNTASNSVQDCGSLV